MAANLIQAEATIKKHVSLDKLMVLLDLYYKIRDNYQDIIDLGSHLDMYSDLDQGSFTLPVIHALKREQRDGKPELISMF